MSSTEAIWLTEGDPQLKRQKMTGDKKKIEKGLTSQSWNPQTTPSQHAQVPKEEPPPLATEPEWIPGYTLSQQPPEIRQALFLKKKPFVTIEKKVRMEEFEDYDVMDPIYRMGWGGILELESDICYDQPVIEWMSTLQRLGEGASLALSGMVRGKQYTLTHDKIRRMFNVDTGIRGEPSRAYEYPDESYLEPSNLETQEDWIDRLQELFFLPPEIHPVKYTELGMADLKPQAKVLWRVGVWNIFPREGYQDKVWVRDISILYGLISGRVAISYAHLVMLNLWATYEKCRPGIPHGYLLSTFLDNEGAITTTDMELREIKLQNRTFTQQCIPHLEFSLGPPFYIEDWENRKFIANFEPGEREIVEREKAERVRKRHGVQEQASGDYHRSPTTERGESPSVDEILNLNESDHFVENALPTEDLSSSESCTTCVRGYQVKNNLAPILEAIFMKHGDIADTCVFKAASVREFFLGLICEVVIELQTSDDTTIISKMEEIEANVSDVEKANIHVSWLRSNLEARKTSSLLEETKAKTIMAKKAAKMKLRKIRTELRKAKRLVKVLGLVHKKLKDNIHQGYTPIL